VVPAPPRWRLRVLAFGLLVLLCAAVGVAYLVHVDERTANQERDARKVAVAGPAALAAYSSEPHVLLRSTALGDMYGRVALVRLHDVSGPRAASGLTCERVDFAGGRGVCLQADRGVVTTYHGVIFNSRLRAGRAFDLAGSPSRVRVSPDGHWAGVTVFVTGHSYADLNFSTQTNIVNLQTGEQLPDLEHFTVRHNGEVVDSIDRNYWGVTFKRDSDGFYATLQTGGKIYLIDGDIASRSATVIGDDVECPSLSPDGTKIAFKERTGGSGLSAVSWHLDVLDLASGRRWRLAETRSVDDQVAWENDDTVIYGLPTSSSGSAETDVWSVPADGSGNPSRWIPRAWSPSVVAS
jgi:hypothetical protein